MRVLVTGGAGFIGSAVCHALIARGAFVINVDKLTYAANPRSLDGITAAPHYAFERLDICDRVAMDAGNFHELLAVAVDAQPDAARILRSVRLDVNV